MTKKTKKIKHIAIYALLVVVLFGGLAVWASRSDFSGDCHFVTMGSNSIESIELCASGRKVDPVANLWEWIYEIKVPENNTFSINSFGVSTGCVSRPYGERHPDGWGASGNNGFDPGNFNWVANTQSNNIGPGQRATFSFIVDKEPIFNGAAGAGAGSVTFKTTDTLGCPGEDKPTPPPVPVTQLDCDGNLPPKADGAQRYKSVFRATGESQLFAKGFGQSEKTYSATPSIPAGTYNVTLVSYDNHSELKESPSQTDERWMMELRSSRNTSLRIGSPTGLTEDIPDNANYRATQVATNFVVPQTIFTVAGVHALKDTTNAATSNSVTPVCAAFDTPVEAPPPTAKQARITINADAWIGNKSVTASDVLKIGPNTLVISSGNVISSKGVPVSNYSLPSAGKAAWQQIEDLMRQRVGRALDSAPSVIGNSDCGNNPPVTDVYLMYGKTLFRGAARDAGNNPDQNNFVVWWLNDNQPCNIILGKDSNSIVHIHGRGTIINAIDTDIRNGLRNNKSITGGTLEIRGKLEFDNQNDTMGYISFNNPSVPDSGSVTIGSGAQIKNLAIFTSGQVIIKPNTSGNDVTHEGHIISRYIKFPDTKAMNADITFNAAKALAKNPPPLFDEFLLPGGRETP